MQSNRKTSRKNDCPKVQEGLLNGGFSYHSARVTLPPFTDNEDALPLP
jgi:hypothetical protein